MINEILIISLIIIVVLIFLLLIISLNIHLLFYNHNLDNKFTLIINFSAIQILIEKITTTPKIILKLNIGSKSIKIFSIKLRNDDNTHNSEDDNQSLKQLFSKIKKIYPLLNDSKTEIYEIVLLISKIIKFQESQTKINIGLKDNNLTIKLCNLLWIFTAPLYSLQMLITITPIINNYILESDIDLKFKINTLNIFKIIFIILKNKKLHKIIKIIIR